MSKAQHTPGPWTIRKDRFNVEIPEIGWRFMFSHSTNIADDAEIKASERGQREVANCFLVAAAPDLLAACKLGLSHVTELREAWRTGALGEHDGQGGTRSNRNVEVESAFRAAIAKAQESP
jgi:hypothetical protein